MQKRRILIVDSNDELRGLLDDVLSELGHEVVALSNAQVATTRADLDRFDRVLGSAEAISGAVGRTNRVARTALSSPVIKAAGIATGTTRAVRRLRRGA